jgi:hypothetical protein
MDLNNKEIEIENIVSEIYNNRINKHIEFQCVYSNKKNNSTIKKQIYNDYCKKNKEKNSECINKICNHFIKENYDYLMNVKNDEKEFEKFLKINVPFYITDYQDIYDISIHIQNYFKLS